MEKGISLTLRGLSLPVAVFRELDLVGVLSIEVFGRSARIEISRPLS